MGQGRVKFTELKNREEAVTPQADQALVSS